MQFELPKHRNENVIFYFFEDDPIALSGRLVLFLGDLLRFTPLNPIVWSCKRKHFFCGSAYADKAK
jgi:hypothetical protein